MFDEFLKSLEKSVAEGLSLDQNYPKALLLKIAKNKECQEAVAKLAAVGKNQSLPSLIGRGKNIIVLHRTDTWEVTMVRQALFKVEPYLVSAPDPILGYCIAGVGTTRLVYNKIIGNMDALSSAHDWTLKETRLKEIKKGDVYSCSDPNVVMDFKELSPSHIFLRFVRRPIAPLLYVFERESRRFSYHTFSDEVATGQFFFSDLIHNMVNNPDCKANLSKDQGADLIKFCNSQIENETLNMSTRWRLLQALGMVAEKDAIKWLKEFSTHPDPGVSQLAGATLEQIKAGGGQ